MLSGDNISGIADANADVISFLKEVKNIEDTYDVMFKCPDNNSESHKVEILNRIIKEGFSDDFLPFETATVDLCDEEKLRKLCECAKDKKSFDIICETEFESKHRFDQCGIVMYLDSENWIKEDILGIYMEKQFGCDYIVADNGAVIMKPDGEIVCDTRCEKDIIKPLLNLLFEENCPWGEVHAGSPFTVYAEKTDEGFTLEEMPEISYFTQVSTMLDDFESAEKVTRSIRDKFGDKLNPLQNGRCIDIVRNDMNKAKGLYLLAEIIGAEYDDIISVGDNINDMDMIKEFRSYAMENGVDCVKEKATYITKGITELIEKELS
ncbi:MAG: DUF1349 domain-containing protein [Ruminococcaceae bacterium]|nr:DUF1349 domain-containing protein [Oscillospiraceae bacterium]